MPKSLRESGIGLASFGGCDGGFVNYVTSSWAGRRDDSNLQNNAQNGMKVIKRPND